MKKKGSRVSLRTVACLAILSNAALAAGADAPANDSASSDQARVAQTTRDDRQAKQDEEEKSWLLTTTMGNLSVAAFAPAGGSFRAFAAPIAGAAPTVPTSGTLSSAANVTYSTAPWVITAGDGSYPGAGGVATFNEQIGTTPGTFPAVPVVTLDVPVTLSGLTFNSVYQYQVSAGTGGSLSLTTTGINTLSVPVSNVSSPTLFVAGDVIAAPIGGGGTFGLTKTGAGTITLAATNTYTGGTSITGGALRITTGDAALGATGAGNDVTLDGGILFVSTTALTTARNFTLGSGGGTLELFAAASISGVVSGTGSLTSTIGSALTLSGADTYSGTTTLLSGGSLILTNANGSLLNSSALDLSGTLTLTNSGTNNNNRVNDAAGVTLRGATISVGGNSTVATTESMGAVTVAGGSSTITVTPNSATANTLTLASVARSSNSTLFARGTSLGAASAAGVGEIKITSAPVLTGGGGTAGSTNISIVPWMVGNVSASATTGSSFVTYTSGTGLRPLTASEYIASATFAGATSTSNVLLSAAATVPTNGITVNSVLVTSGSATSIKASSGNILTITSGALLYSPSSAASTAFAANLNFGSAEGIISTSVVSSSSSAEYSLTLSGVLAGSGGLTLNPFTNTYLSSDLATFAITGVANTYTGTTTLLGGLTTFSGSILKDGSAGAFGEDTSAIVINAGATGARLYATSAGAVINRDLTISGSAAGTVGLGTLNVTTLTVNGNIALNRPLSLEGGGSSTAPLIVNGNITGSSYLTDAGTYISYNILNGNNTYSGGTNINYSTYVAGSDTAFGTGTIYTGSSGTTAGTITGSGTGVRTIGNNFTFLNGTTASFTFGGTTPLLLSGGINLDGTTSLTFSNTGGTTMSGVVANGGLTKLGAATLTLSNANTYTGGTVISAGTVYVTNTSGSGTGSGAISVTAGTLGGTGFIVNTVPAGSTAATTSIASGAIIQGGTGGATGALTLNGNLTLVSSSIIELGLSNTSTNSSLARAGGVWVLPTGIKFTFTGSPTTGEPYVNLITGLAADPGTEGSWTITNSGFTGNFYYDGMGDIDVLPVPEPATVFGGLACTGLLGVHLRRRFKRQAARA